MSNVKKGQLIKPKEWAKHLRKFGKRVFWSAHRKAEQKEIKQQIKE